MKKSFIALLLIVLLATCLCVSCKNEPGAGQKWVSTYTESETAEEGTFVYTITATLEFDGKGGAKMTTHLDNVKLGGVDITNTVPENMRTDVLTGTYTDTEITFTYVEEGITVTEKGTYTISGDKLTVTADKQTHVFTKQ